MNTERPQQTPILGTAEYIAALDTICSNAQHNLFVFDKDLIHCGFNSHARYETLNRFLYSSPKNRLLLLAHDTRQVSQFCPRLMMLLRQFSHNMHIFQTPRNLHHLTEPFAVADEAQYVRRFHFDEPQGILANKDSEYAHLLKSRFMEMWGVSHAHASTATFRL